MILQAQLSTCPINTHYSRSGAEVKQQPLVIRSPLPPGAAITIHQPTTSLAVHDASAARLTSEQADFVNDLRRANVPAADIAVVMERMQKQWDMVRAAEGAVRWVCVQPLQDTMV